jgi:hypothetical protein
MAKTSPEMMRWEAQSLLITADKLADRERRKAVVVPRHRARPQGLDNRSGRCFENRDSTRHGAEAPHERAAPNGAEYWRQREGGRRRQNTEQKPQPSGRAHVAGRHQANA